MDDLTNADFDRFFKEMWGYEPFSWQSELASRTLSDCDRPWPEVIKLPTASGKTACLDVAVFGLAAKAGRNDAQRLPRRIFFVVDRRVIVDEAFARAEKMKARLLSPEGGITREVADRLRSLSGTSTPLECYELRGGMYRSDSWARSPRQPTIIASTVDQIGSRLLFRTYGRNFKTWPIHAGLAGNDALVLLDEAHCAQPFMQTLRSVATYRKWAKSPLPSPFHGVVMSATPPEGMEDVFVDESDEPRNPDHPLGKRQLASKPSSLAVVPKAKGKKAVELMAKGLARKADELAEGDQKAVVVFTNRVATARETARLLSVKKEQDVVLLTGRMRAFDKDDVVARRLSLLASGSASERDLSRSLFVVATQTLEVGADLDFDALVTECASLDALRQRFGRLNRTGRDIEGSAAVLVREDQSESSDDDPVYGGAIAATWKWLKRNADEEERIDFQIAGMSARLPTGEDLAELESPKANAPVMLPAHVDALAQTSPGPFPSPEISLFLHGATPASADVQVCWRADIDVSDDENAAKSIDALSLCPPAAVECLAVPIWVMRQWLSGVESVDHGADVEGEVPPDEKKQHTDLVARRVVRWRGRDEADVITEPGELKPGDAVVIPASCGDATVLGDLARGEDGAVTLDFGDRAFFQIRGKPLLRLHPEVLEQWPRCESKSLFMAMSVDGDKRWLEDPDALAEEVGDALLRLERDETASDWLRSIAGALVAERRLVRKAVLHPLGGVVLRGDRKRLEVETSAATTDEDDVAASGTVDVTLKKHLDGVGEMARTFAEGCGLPAALVDALSTTGRLHDLGKADPRFQALLRAGDLWASGDLLAKSGRMPQSRAEFERARRASGFPKGGRHELLSAKLIESDPTMLPEDDTLADLVRHLVMSHHGHGRPFAPVIEDSDPVDTNFDYRGHELDARSATGLENVGSGVAERFWRLVRHHGWWGLAWLEALVRLADHRRSEQEERERGGGR